MSDTIEARSRNIIELRPQSGQPQPIGLSDIRMISVAKDGSELVIEFTRHDERRRTAEQFEARITGRNLRPVATAVSEGRIHGLEAFDSHRHDRPDDDDAPVIDDITFDEPEGSKGVA